MVRNGESRTLSTRAAEFLRQCRGQVGALPERPAVEPRFTVDGDVAPEDFAAVRNLISHVNREYGGLEISVFGGVLHGRLKIGIKDEAPVWNVDGDGYVFRVARHSDAQCAVTMNQAGRFGVSWGFDFWPLFDSLEHFVEASAIWSLYRGWRYSAIMEAVPRDVVSVLGEATPDEAASGELAQWWRGDGYAVVSERYLNPHRSRLPQVKVLADSRARSAAVHSLLEESGLVKASNVAAELHGVVAESSQ